MGKLIKIVRENVVIWVFTRVHILEMSTSRYVSLSISSSEDDNAYSESLSDMSSKTDMTLPLIVTSYTLYMTLL